MKPRRPKQQPRSSPRERLLVVAAVIESHGRILACQRRKNDAFGLKWEFPGGKVQPGEQPAQALARELKEELGVEAAVGEEQYRTRHRYAELAREIELIFFTAQVDEKDMRNLAFEQMRWVRPDELAKLDFLPADREIITRLASQPAKKRHF
jgi:8-oxo-dGTP diphosphatase